MQPALRTDPQHPPSPNELLLLTLESLDFSWEIALASELAGGAVDRAEAERRVGNRYRREDQLRLRQKIQRWEKLADARHNLHRDP